MKPRTIVIQFPAHVQTWTVTPHGAELAGTARRVPPPGQGLKAPVAASHTKLQPRAELARDATRTHPQV